MVWFAWFYPPSITQSKFAAQDARLLMPEKSRDVIAVERVVEGEGEFPAWPPPSGGQVEHGIGWFFPAIAASIDHRVGIIGESATDYPQLGAGREVAARLVGQRQVGLVARHVGQLVTHQRRIGEIADDAGSGISVVGRQRPAAGQTPRS